MCYRFGESSHRYTHLFVKPLTFLLMIYCRRSEERLYFISKFWMQRDEIIIQMTLMWTTFPLYYFS